MKTTITHEARYIMRLLETNKYSSRIDGTNIYTSAKAIDILSLMARNGIETDTEHLDCGIVMVYWNGEVYRFMEENNHVH